LWVSITFPHYWSRKGKKTNTFYMHRKLEMGLAIKWWPNFQSKSCLSGLKENLMFNLKNDHYFISKTFHILSDIIFKLTYIWSEVIKPFSKTIKLLFKTSSDQFSSIWTFSNQVNDWITFHKIRWKKWFSFVLSKLYKS